MIIDGTDLILGRLASIVAKKALLGEKVDIVNCEKIIISGNTQNIVGRQQAYRKMGNHYNGPFIPRVEDRFVRRSIRRMLPHKKSRGREAFKRIMCHIGVPPQFSQEKANTVKEAHISQLQTLKLMTVGALCKKLK